MTRPAILRYLRIELIAGKHLAFCFAAAAVRAEGLRRIYAARRIERRLQINTGINL